MNFFLINVGFNGKIFTGSPSIDGVDDLNFFDGPDTCVSELFSSSERVSIEDDADRLPTVVVVVAFSKNQ
jgi:hypothetical protein